MATPAQKDFLLRASPGAVAAQHIFLATAAGEAAPESGRATSELAVKANHLFGQKQCVHPEYGTLILPTEEFPDQKWVTEDAYWISFPAVADCFVARMDTLRRLAPHFSHYAAALAAKTRRNM